MLAAARAPDFESVFIDGDDALEARYGERVPVLRDESRGAELDWPFDAQRCRLLWRGLSAGSLGASSPPSFFKGGSQPAVFGAHAAFLRKRGPGAFAFALRG